MRFRTLREGWPFALMPLWWIAGYLIADGALWLVKHYSAEQLMRAAFAAGLAILILFALLIIDVIRSILDRDG